MLKKIIEEYNQPKIGGNHFIVRQLSATVHYAQLWPDFALGFVAEDVIFPRVFYFIKDKDTTIGGVELFDTSLDCFMSPQYRGKSLFSTAMKEFILPHILQQKPLQRLHLNRSEFGERKFEVLKKIFVALGFSVLKEDTELRMVIDASRRPAGRFISGENKPLEQRRKEVIQKEFLWFSYRLTLIRAELELQEGISYQSEDIGDMIQRLQEFGRR